MLEVQDIKATKNSDNPGTDRYVKTSDLEFKSWIVRHFCESNHRRLDEEDKFDDVALALANQCREDWNRFWQRNRTVYVAILNKPCTKEDLAHGKKTGRFMHHHDDGRFQ